MDSGRRRWHVLRLLCSWAALGACLLAAVACRDSAPAPAALAKPAAASRAWTAATLDFAGCRVLRAGPRCELGPTRELTFWLPGADPQLTAAGDGKPLALAAPGQVLGGARYALHVPADVQQLVLSVPDGRAFTLSMQDEHPTPVLASAAAARAAGKLDEAEAQLRAALPTLTPEDAGRAGAALARIALARGQVDAAVSGLQAALDDALARSRLSDAIRDGTALAFTLIARQQDYARAHQVLDRLSALRELEPVGRAILPHYEGTLAMYTGDLRRALTLFRQSISATARLGLSEHELPARQYEAMTLSLLGRNDEAIAALRELTARASTSDACRAVDAYEQLLWQVILSELAEEHVERSIAYDAIAQAEHFLTQCRAPNKHRNHAINLGLYAWTQGDLPSVDVALAQLANVQGGQDETLASWELELRARLALARRQARAAQSLFAQERERSERAGLWDNQLLAMLGVGRSLQAQGKLRDSVGVYEAAETLMDRLLAGIPLGEGQAGFIATRQRSSEQLIGLYLQLHQPEQALLAAWRARARIVRSSSYPALLAQLPAAARARFEAAVARYRNERAALEKLQADAWQLPADQQAQQASRIAERNAAALQALDEAHAVLQGGTARATTGFTAPPSGTVRLTYLTLGAQLIGFVTQGTRTRAVTLSGSLDKLDSDRAVLGALLLGPFASELASAQRVEIVTQGQLGLVDVHALLLQGKSLSERLPVSYKLDTLQLMAADAARSGAAVIGNPTGNLPHASLEAKAVAQALPAPVDLLLEHAADRAHILAALSHATLFHYAGHGEFGGRDGLGSGLLLADGALALGEILALPSVPPLVILSACEGARSDTHGLAAGLSLGQAFVAAGARAVIASTRPVKDADAELLFAKFYATLAKTPSDPVLALRDAQLQTQLAVPSADWAAFRVLVP